MPFQSQLAVALINSPRTKKKEVDCRLFSAFCRDFLEILCLVLFQL